MRWVVAVVVFLGLCGVLVYLGYLQGREAFVAGYNQGYQDALYKRPVSDELEFVCAGLWVGEESRKYIEKENRGKR